MVVSGGQLVNVSQGQQMIVQHINPNKATIATINGQQVLIRPNTGELINQEDTTLAGVFYVLKTYNITLWFSILQFQFCVLC